MGQNDGSFEARKKLKNKILGITCHNSKVLARQEAANMKSRLHCIWIFF